MQRSDRVGDELQRVIADIIQNDIKDPRLPGLVSITEVRVSRDLSHANVYVSVLGDAASRKDCAAALRSATGYIRREMTSRVRLRIAPELHFVFDDSIERGIRLTKLIDEAIGGRADDDRQNHS
jgi:ribosome-binding factor A